MLLFIVLSSPQNQVYAKQDAEENPTAPLYQDLHPHCDHMPYIDETQNIDNREGVFIESVVINLTKAEDTTPKKEEDTIKILIIEHEERVPSCQMSICIKEWNIISQWKLKTRHQRNFYSITDVYLVTMREQYSTSILMDSKEISRKLIRREARLIRHDQESCECGSHGKTIPSGVTFL